MYNLFVLKRTVLFLYGPPCTYSDGSLNGNIVLASHCFFFSVGRHFSVLGSEILNIEVINFVPTPQF